MEHILAKLLLFTSKTAAIYQQSCCCLQAELLLFTSKTAAICQHNCCFLPAKLLLFTSEAAAIYQRSCCYFPAKLLLYTSKAAAIYLPAKLPLFTSNFCFYNRSIFLLFFFSNRSFAFVILKDYCYMSTFATAILLF